MSWTLQFVLSYREEVSGNHPKLCQTTFCVGTLSFTTYNIHLIQLVVVVVVAVEWHMLTSKQNLEEINR